REDRSRAQEVAPSGHSNGGRIPRGRDPACLVLLSGRPRSARHVATPHPARHGRTEGASSGSALVRNDTRGPGARARSRRGSARWRLDDLADDQGTTNVAGVQATPWYVVHCTVVVPVPVPLSAAPRLIRPTFGFDVDQFTSVVTLRTAPFE